MKDFNAGGFYHKATLNVLLVLKQAIFESGSFFGYPILAVLTDHGFRVLC